MKIAFISEYNIYTSIGGTENYLDLLISGLVENGIDIFLITQGINSKIKTGVEKTQAGKPFNICFIPKQRYSSAEIKQDKASSTWLAIEKILVHEQPDIIHVHTYSTFFNVRHFELCNRDYPRIIFTSHVPGHFCPKGDLIKFNSSPCDGRIYERCIACMFSQGLKTGVSNLLFGYYKKVLNRLTILNRQNITLVCVSEWQQRNAIMNGYDENKTIVIRQAILPGEVANTNGNLEGFTIGYLGRLSAEKGSAFLFNIIEELIENTIYNIVLALPPENSDRSEVSKLDMLQKLNPLRLKIMAHINASNKEVFFNEIDCLLIPSFCMETGPIVLLEALEYGKWVLGPDIGGPLEYAREFPTQVRTYSWNNTRDAMNKITALAGEKIIHTGMRIIMKKRASEFISQHIDLYKNILAG